jgi:hypothetical protein
MKKATLSIKETAREFGFPEYAVRTLAKRSAFPCIWLGNRCYIVREVFADYLRSGGELYEVKH